MEKLKTFVEKNGLRLYEEVDELCIKPLARQTILTMELVEFWAQYLALFHQGYAREEKDNELYFTVQDHVNPSTIMLESHDGLRKISGILLNEGKLCTIHEAIVRDLIFLVFKCPNFLEALYTFLSSYNNIYPVSLGLLNLVHRYFYKMVKGASEVLTFPETMFPDLESEVRMEKLQEWEYKSQAEFILAFMRYSIGEDAIPDSDLYDAFIRESRGFSAILPEMNNENSFYFQLSVGVEELARDSAFATAEKFSETLEKLLINSGKKYGVGGYMEVRPFYNTESYKKKTWIGNRWRTMHLGVDLWCEAGTLVYAPVPCEVFSVYDNNIPGDYGPTVILKMTGIDYDLYFLYGHMSRETLRELEKGKVLKAGEKVGTIGTAMENGGWPPHLHFQVIRSIFHNTHNFNGLCDPQYSDFWKQVCPSPSPFIKVELSFHEKDTTSGEMVNIFIRRDGARVYDKDAQRYLDYRVSKNKYGFHRDPLPEEEVEKLHREISIILEKENFRTFQWVELGLLKWNLFVGREKKGKDSEVKNLYENIHGMLIEGGVLTDRVGDAIVIQVPHCTTPEEINFLCQVLKEIELLVGRDNISG